MAELKSCPFCGGEAKYMNITEGIFISRFVTCAKCGIETKRNYFRRNEAIEAWNTRKPMEAVVAELEKILGDTNFEKATKEVNESFYDGLAYAYGMAISIVRGKE